jgi:hypothetical protein
LTLLLFLSIICARKKGVVIMPKKKSKKKIKAKAKSKAKTKVLKPADLPKEDILAEDKMDERVEDHDLMESRFKRLANISDGGEY